MTNGQILSELYRRLNYEASPPSAVTTRLQSFVNLAHRQLLGMPGMERLRDNTITFASVASQARYGLPQSIARVQTLHDRTNDRRLVQRSLDWLRTADPGLDSSGTPEAYIPVGLTPVAVQPSDASEIFIKSTAAGDTGTAYLEGIRTGGYSVSLNITMTGVTAKTFGATYTDIVEITKLYISAAAVGTITLHEDSGAGAELARIPIGQTQSRYWGVQLYPIPAGVTTYYVDYTRQIPDMSITNDEPLLPPDFHWLLVEGALLMEWGQKKDDSDRYAIVQRAYDKGVSALKYFVRCPPDELPVLGRGQGVRVSRLGGFYPADTWVR